MKNKNITYHSRLYDDDVKASSGSFGGDIDLETVERLVKHHDYRVEVLQSGTPVLVDRNGQRVRLYIQVHPRNTTLGQDVIRDYYLQCARENERKVKERKALMDRLDALNNMELKTLLLGDADVV